MKSLDSFLELIDLKRKSFDTISVKIKLILKKAKKKFLKL